MTLPTLSLEPSLSPTPSPRFGKAAWTCASLTPETAWRGGLTAVAARAAGGPDDLAKVMVAGEVAGDPEAMPGALGPESHDEWLRRIREANGPGASILFYARDLARHDRTLFEVLLSAAGPVFAGSGLSRREVDVELFCGQYRATPGGIHREYCANNHFVLAGRKFMHFWTGDDWIPDGTERDHADGPVGESDEEYLPSLRVEAVSAHGDALSAGPGEVFGWANGVWHVGETDDGPALAINLARYMSSFDPDESAFRLEAEADGRVAPGWLDAYRSYLAVDKGADEALAMASAYGIPGADPGLPAVPPPARVVSLTHAPLLWCADGEGVLVATHGRSRRFPADRVRWVREFAALGAGEECAVPDGAQGLASWLVTHSALSAA
ncbi:hypothetical protein AB0C59_21010 [Streptomyces sp. NPDC048664]|uniref:hypothetical protein n=1 Tax=Streptomyces sp. NPDC048664 TaxID=3154505 RepID=UPI003436D9D8